MGVIIIISLLGVNYYTNIEKDAHYIEVYGYSQNLEDEVKEN